MTIPKSMHLVSPSVIQLICLMSFCCNYFNNCRTFQSLLFFDIIISVGLMILNLDYSAHNVLIHIYLVIMAIFLNYVDGRILELHKWFLWRKHQLTELKLIYLTFHRFFTCFVGKLHFDFLDCFILLLEKIYRTKKVWINISSHKLNGTIVDQMVIPLGILIVWS